MLDYALSHGVQPITIPEIVGEFSPGASGAECIGPAFSCDALRASSYRAYSHRQGRVCRSANGTDGSRSSCRPYLSRHILQGYYSPRKTQPRRGMERLLARLTKLWLLREPETARRLVCDTERLWLEVSGQSRRPTS